MSTKYKYFITMTDKKTKQQKRLQLYYGYVDSIHANLELLGIRFVVPHGCLFGEDELGQWAFTRPNSCSTNKHGEFTCAIWRFNFFTHEWECNYPDKYCSALDKIYDFMTHRYKEPSQMGDDIVRYSTKEHEYLGDSLNYQARHAFSSKCPTGRKTKSTGLKEQNKRFFQRADNINAMNFGEHCIAGIRK